MQACKNLIGNGVVVPEPRHNNRDDVALSSLYMDKLARHLLDHHKLDVLFQVVLYFTFRLGSPHHMLTGRRLSPSGVYKNVKMCMLCGDFVTLLSGVEA